MFFGVGLARGWIEIIVGEGLGVAAEAALRLPGQNAAAVGRLPIKGNLSRDLAKFLPR